MSTKFQYKRWHAKNCKPPCECPAKTFRAPVKGSENAAAYDIFCPSACTIPAGGMLMVPLGLSGTAGPGFHFQLRERSSIARDKRIETSAGLIDGDYRGEWIALLNNRGTAPFEIEAGDRVVQAELCITPESTPEEVEELTATDRQAGGFGSTGTADVTEEKTGTKIKEPIAPGSKKRKHDEEPTECAESDRVPQPTAVDEATATQDPDYIV